MMTTDQQVRLLVEVVTDLAATLRCHLANVTLVDNAEVRKLNLDKVLGVEKKLSDARTKNGAQEHEAAG